jgi:SAM-dependent methyltransferase
MTELEGLRRTWDGLALQDPFWAILTDPNRAQNRWRAEEFFETGKEEIRIVLQYLESRSLTPDLNGSVLDFGCGAGRLTQALADRFHSAVGLDISEAMVALARTYNRFPDSCQYVCSASTTLPFADNAFGLVYSSIVLQHMESHHASKYIAEFLRVLEPEGVLVFQVADRRKGQSVRQTGAVLKRTFTRALQRMGIASGQMEVHCLPEDKIRKIAIGAGGRIVDVQVTNSLAPDFNGQLRFLPAETAVGFVAKQYCVRKIPRASA